jgi:hypothetical protein
MIIPNTSPKQPLPENKAITASPKKMLDKKPMVPKPNGHESTDSKIQKTLLVVDNIRLQTINTLEALQDLSREDSVKLSDLNRSMRELVNVSNGILDANTKAPEGEAQNFLRALDETNKLLSKYKDTQIKGMTLEKFLEKQEVEHDRQVLRDKEIAKIITDASHSLGRPFAEFLEQNIQRISTTPVSQGAFDTTVAALGGPLAPLITLIGRSIPEALSEFRGIKESFVGLKEKVLGKKDEIKKIGSGLDVDKALKIQDSKIIPVAPTQVDNKDEQEASQNNQEQSEAAETAKFHSKVLTKLSRIDNTLEKDLDDIKDNTKAAAANGGGGIGSVLSTIGGKLGGLGKVLGKVLPFLGKGGLVGAGLYGAYKGGEALKEKLKDPESDVHKFAKEHAPWAIPDPNAKAVDDEDEDGPLLAPLTKAGSLLKLPGHELKSNDRSLDERITEKITKDELETDYSRKVPTDRHKIELKAGLQIGEMKGPKKLSGPLQGDKTTINDEPQKTKKLEPLKEKPPLDADQISKALSEQLAPFVKLSENQKAQYPSPKLVDMIHNMPQDPITQLINSGTL